MIRLIKKYRALMVFIGFMAFGLQAVELSLYEHAVMPGGPFEGQLLDTSKIRGLVLLNEATNILPEPLSKSHGYVANISHNGKFYVGRVSYEAPVGVSFVFEKFVEMAGGHANLVYQFDKNAPLELLYEIKDLPLSIKQRLVKLEEPIRLDHIVLTAELVRAQGDNTGLKKGGLDSSFTLGYRMTSVPERLIESVITRAREVTAYDIPFQPHEVKTSFWQTVVTQSQIGMNTNYNLIVNSCITAAIEGLANGLPEEKRKLLQEELQRSIQKIGAAGRKDISLSEIKNMVEGLTEILGENRLSIRVEPILQEKYFTDWLTQEQIEAARSSSCRRLFF